MLPFLRLTSRNIIPTNDIIYLESDWNYTVVYTLDNSRYVSGFTLKVLEKRIADSNFLRINRGLLINSQYIRRLCSDKKEAFVMMKNGEMLPVSRRKYDLIKESITADW
jgi:two-component system LytT family response regulator